MKITVTIARYLLGIIFVVFGLNGFFHFIPQGPMPDGPAGQWIAAATTSHYMDFVFVIQLAAGILFLINRYVPLALTIIAPVIVNIVAFHATMLPTGLPLAVVVVVLWVLVAWRVWDAFSGILQARGA
jgi:putative oxidoreductase